jgi:hypothetical protein
MTLNIELKFDFCQKPLTHYNYQKYYVQGFRTVDDVNLEITPFSSGLFAKLVDCKVKGAARAWNKFATITKNKRSVEANHVGRYIFDNGSKCVKVAIDSADGRSIRHWEAYEWADFYFKANKWPNMEYPAKVYPIVNGNGILDANRIRFLRSLANEEKSVDLVFISRVWPSPSGTYFFNGIEHNIRLFESLSKLGCSKELKAVIPRECSPSIMGKYFARLDAVSVAWSYDQIPPAELWRSLARARIVLLRAGKHLAVPWRMLDYLCMGTCVVYDQVPYPQWPIPLRPGENYVDCDCGLGIDESLPSKEKYAQLEGVIGDLLGNYRAIEAIRANNRNYFDKYAAPQKVAEYVIDIVSSN